MSAINRFNEDGQDLAFRLADIAENAAAALEVLAGEWDRSEDSSDTLSDLAERTQELADEARRLEELAADLAQEIDEASTDSLAYA
jgi:NTP pyrophosphatase (non-canonical NTP hydrolase)